MESNQEYGGLPTITIDFNTIEVNKGFFFLINEKRVTHDWYLTEEFGRVIPRDFKDYTFNGSVPYPKEYVYDAIIFLFAIAYKVLSSMMTFLSTKNHCLTVYNLGIHRQTIVYFQVRRKSKKQLS